MRSFLFYSAFSIAALNAVSITPIRAILGDEDALLTLCVGNLVAAKVPGSHDIADLKVDLKGDKKVHCGPNNIPASKSLLDLLLLGEDSCSHLKLLNTVTSQYGEGIGGIDIVLNTIQPHCKNHTPKPNGETKTDPIPPVTPKPVDPKPPKDDDRRNYN